MILKFGKHKGQKFENTPKSYQDWLLKQDWFNAPKKEDTKRVIKPNTGDTIEGNICVHFEAEKCAWIVGSGVPTGKIVKEYLPNAHISKAMTCEEIESAFFKGDFKTHHPRFRNCKVTHVQARTWVAGSI